MDEPGSSRSALEQLALDFFPGISRDEARAKLDELVTRWRGDTVRLRERTGEAVEKVARELGLVSRAEYDELELRLAQLEHRLSLLEDRK